MKFLVVLSVALACACADVSHIARSADADAQVLKYESDIKPNGEYAYAYEVSNGISESAQGVYKNVQNAESPVPEVTGQYGYVGPDGVNYVVKYIANEFGYQPTGDHLPVAPEIPEAIRRSLEYNAAHPQAENKNENYQRAASVPVQTPFKPAPSYKPFGKF